MDVLLIVLGSISALSVLLTIKLTPQFLLNEFKLRQSKNVGEMIIIDEVGNAKRVITDKIPKELIWAKDKKTGDETATKISQTPLAIDETVCEIEDKKTLIKKTFIFNKESKRPLYLVYTWEPENVNPFKQTNAKAFSKAINLALKEGIIIGRMQVTNEQAKPKDNNLLIIVIIGIVLVGAWLLMGQGDLLGTANSVITTPVNLPAVTGGN